MDGVVAEVAFERRATSFDLRCPVGLGGHVQPPAYPFGQGVVRHRLDRARLNQTTKWRHIGGKDRHAHRNGIHELRRQLVLGGRGRRVLQEADKIRRRCDIGQPVEGLIRYEADGVSAKGPQLCLEWLVGWRADDDETIVRSIRRFDRPEDLRDALVGARRANKHHHP